MTVSGYKIYWNYVNNDPYLFNGSSFISYDDEEAVKYFTNESIKGYY